MSLTTSGPLTSGMETACWWNTSSETLADEVSCLMQMRRNSNSFRTPRSESCSRLHRLSFYERCIICNMYVLDSVLLQRQSDCLFLWNLAGRRCDLHHLRLNLNNMTLHDSTFLGTWGGISCVKVGAGDPRLQNFRFKQVLVDESTQVGWETAVSKI